MTICPKKLGLTFGVLWGASLFLLALICIPTEWGIDFIEVLGSVYIGYDLTILGSIIGGIWGFVDGFITGYLIVWLYNRL